MSLRVGGLGAAPTVLGTPGTGARGGPRPALRSPVPAAAGAGGVTVDRTPPRGGAVAAARSMSVRVAPSRPRAFGVGGTGGGGGGGGGLGAWPAEQRCGAPRASRAAAAGRVSASYAGSAAAAFGGEFKANRFKPLEQTSGPTPSTSGGDGDGDGDGAGDDAYPPQPPMWTGPLGTVVRTVLAFVAAAFMVYVRPAFAASAAAANAAAADSAAAATAAAAAAAATATSTPSAAGLVVGPGGHFSPRHRSHSTRQQTRDQSAFVSMTWQALSGRH
jgi:hypothetical protein